MLLGHLIHSNACRSDDSQLVQLVFFFLNWRKRFWAPLSCQHELVSGKLTLLRLHFHVWYWLTSSFFFFFIIRYHGKWMRPRSDWFPTVDNNWSWTELYWNQSSSIKSSIFHLYTSILIKLSNPTGGLWHWYGKTQEIPWLIPSEEQSGKILLFLIHTQSKLKKMIRTT